MRLLLSYALFDLGVSAARGLRQLAVGSRHGGGVRGCRCRRTAAVGELGYLDRPHLIQGLFGGRVPLSYGQLVRCSCVTVQTVAVEVAVVERREDYAFPYAADSGFSLELPARRLDTHHVAFLHSEALCVRGRELDPDLRCSIL